MTVALEQFAAELAVTPQELERRSLLAYIERERRLIALDIADLQDRYDVHTYQELSKRIEQRRVYSHPAWEDPIEWERLTAYLAQIQDWELQLEIAANPADALREFRAFVRLRLQHGN